MALPFIAIYGLGRFGKALAGALDERRLPLVRVGGRGPAPTEWETMYARGPAAFTKGLVEGAVVMLAVPDDALSAVADEFAAQPDHARFAYTHPSGVRGIDALSALKDCERAVFHILQSFPPDGAAELVPGSYGTITGSARLAARLRELANALEVNIVEITDEQRIHYHAAAVLASNAVTALLDTGRTVLEQAGFAPEHAGKMLVPLTRGTLRNVQALGAAQALTGPVVRGDVGTIQRHLEVLKGPTRRTYIAAMQATADLAQLSGRTDPAKLQAIRELLAKG